MTKKLIDLSHQLSPAIPTWSSEQGFSLKTELDYQDCTTQTKFRVQSICMNAGIGTHMDAPAHCIKDGLTIAQIPLKDLMVLLIVINVADRADATYQFSVNDIAAFEKQYGIIPAASLVIVYTGWSKYWGDRQKYHNQHQFPSVSPAAAELLVARGIVGLGIDTLSPDCPRNDHPVHQILLSAGKYIIENVAHADLVPAVGATALVFPLKIEGGTESPVRFVAELP